MVLIVIAALAVCAVEATTIARGARIGTDVSEVVLLVLLLLELPLLLLLPLPLLL
tara:strand:- start:87 stop:251 length:165 start_codon:yes stop_codon:yes gene_type:complete